MAGVTDHAGRPVSGLVPVAVSAVVTDHHDPDGLGRVRVSYATLPGRPESGWLRHVTPDGGEEHGLHALPEVGSEVLVIFLQGSQDAGVVVGALWNGARRPPPEAGGDLPGPAATKIPGAQRSTDAFAAGSGSAAGNDRRLWRSRSGHLVVFDDTSGRESVQIWDGTHTMALVFDVASQRVVLSNSGADLHLRTARDLFLEAGRDVILAAGRHVEATARGDVTVTAGGIAAESRLDTKITAGANLRLEARVDATIRATGTFEARGVTAAVKGTASGSFTAGAMVEIRAGLVKIN